MRAEAPFWNRLFAIATAAYEHDEDAAPRPVARRIGASPEPESAASIRSRGARACTAAEIAKPKTSAHQTLPDHQQRVTQAMPETPTCGRHTPLGYPSGADRPRLLGDEGSAHRATATAIAGQIGGIERMVCEDRYCIDVLTQIHAVQAALDKVALGLLDDHAHHCVLGAVPIERAAKTDELMAAVGRLMRRG